MPAVVDPEDSYPGFDLVSCKDYVYDGGKLSFTEDCEREIGRGSAIVESGSCEFYGGNDCEGTPFLSLEQGICDEEIYLSNFTCVSAIHFPTSRRSRFDSIRGTWDC